MAIADETLLPVLGQGTVLLQTRRGPFRLDNVQFVPGLIGPLLSTSALEDAGFGVNCSRNGRFVYHESAPRTPVLHIEKSGNLFVLVQDHRST